MNKIEIAPQNLTEAANRISAIETYLSDDITISRLTQCFHQSDGETVSAIRESYASLQAARTNLLELVKKTKEKMIDIGVKFETVDAKLAKEYFNEIGGRK